jgi:hypothetical protein
MLHTETAKSPSPLDWNLAATVMIVCALAIGGLWLRLSILGERPLARDEYYFVRSVQNVIEYGVPRFASGGYYFRGLLLQYLTAGSIALFGDGHFAYRLPTALFGAGTLVMAYFLGRQFLNRSLSVTLVAMLAFSSWEIELSGFARMYAAFQFAAVGFFWSLYRYAFNGDCRMRYLTVAFALFAILTSEIGVFVALLLFLPLAAGLERGWRATLSQQSIYIALSAAVLGLGLLQALYPFRWVDVSDPLPQDFVQAAGRDLHGLSFGTRWLGEAGFTAIAVLAAALAILGCGYHALRNRKTAGSGFRTPDPGQAHGARSPVEEQILIGLAALALFGAAAHQLAICALILLLVALREVKLLLRKPGVFFLGSCVLIGGFWFALLLADPEWVGAFGPAASPKTYFKAVRLTFFAIPDLYFPVILPWIETLPILAGLLAAAIAWQVVRIRRAPLAAIAAHPVLPIVICVIAFGLRPPLYSETRYSFFLYPLALGIGLLSAGQAMERLAGRFNGHAGVLKASTVGLCLMAFLLSEDYNFTHLRQPNSQAIAYRTGEYQRFERHWYPRWDFLRPAELVNASAPAGSRIIVSLHVNTVAAYLKSEFAMYWPRESSTFPIVSREGGTREMWSGRRLLSTIEEVADYTRGSERVWLVVKGKSIGHRLDPEAVWPGRVKDVQVYGPGRDGRIEVWRIDLKQADGSA